MKDKDSEIFVKCDCHAEGMFVTRFEGEGEFYFSYWGRGITPRNMRLWERVKLCWKVLSTGNAYEDEIILSKDKAGMLAAWINAEINKETLEIRNRELQSTVRLRTEVSIRSEMEQ